MTEVEILHVVPGDNFESYWHEDAAHFHKISAAGVIPDDSTGFPQDENSRIALTAIGSTTEIESIFDRFNKWNKPVAENTAS